MSPDRRKPWMAEGVLRGTGGCGWGRWGGAGGMWLWSQNPGVVFRLCDLSKFYIPASSSAKQEPASLSRRVIVFMKLAHK